MENPLKMLVKEDILGRLTGISHHFAEKLNPLQIRFNYVYTFGTHPITSDRNRAALKFNIYYVTEGILFVRFSRCILQFLLTHDGPFTKARMNNLINNK